MKFLLFCLLSAISLSAAETKDRPNILWITSEDNSFQWLGCYGNEQAHTPNLDKLASEGVRFTNFYSNAPVCAVARSTILMGTYAPTMGTQHMRSRHPIPSDYKPHVSYLREAGYYCTNNSKTDYNFEGHDASYWDECSSSAHYKNRSKGQPFFAIFNQTISHESCLFPKRIEQNRKKGLIPPKTRIAPEDINLPPYLPDLPEVRSDYAVYSDVITALDQQVGDILAELEELGLADDTIIFYYGDHGGATPRGKRYLHDTGVKVPFLLHVPEKWQHLSPFENGTTVDQPAAFVDLAPTLLSLAGIDTPAQMQGRPFLGKHAQPLSDQQTIFLYGDRFDSLYGMRRGLTDGRWKYIRRFTPHLPAAPYSTYSFGQRSWLAWYQAWLDGSLSPQHAAIWEADQPVEELFDTQADPWEIHNLANDPKHSARLAKFREQLKQTMINTLDTGVIPEQIFTAVAGPQPIASYAKSHRKDWTPLVNRVFRATERNPENIPALLNDLTSDNRVYRHWATLGLEILRRHRN